MKKTSLILSSTLLFTACSKTVKEVVQVKENNQPQTNASVTTESSSKDVEALRKLLKSEAPNLALAELLARSASKEHRAELKALIEELSAEEATEVIKKVEEDNLAVRNNYLYHGQTYGNNNKLLGSTLVDPASLKDQPFSVESQLKISTVAYLKSKMLDQIITTYNKRAEELAKDLANDIAYDIGTNHPEVAEEIESEMGSQPKSKVIQQIIKAKPVIEKIDAYFKSSELSEQEQYVLVISGIIAGAVYDQVKNHKGFKHLIAEGQRIARDVKKFQKKAQEFSLLVNTLNMHFDQANTNFRDLRDGITGARNDAFDLYGRIKASKTGVVDVDSKKITDFLYKRVIKGEEAKYDTNPSILSKQTSFNDNFRKTVNAAAGLTNNLNSIVTTVDHLARFFKMSPSNDLMKVLDKAQKVNAVVQGVQAAVAGFATGGFLGAIGALSSGPMGSMLGGGSSRDSAMLDMINKKLDMVLENQQKIMQLQVDTMNMIKDLAMMVDMYHQQEMAAMAELRDYSLITLELEKAQANKGIRHCERIVNFQLSSVWRDMNFGKDSFYSINNLELLNTRFTQSISSLNDIRRIVNSIEEDGFKNCQSGIAEAFGGNSYEENPIRNIYASEEDLNLNEFQRDTYMPLLDGLKFFTETSNFDRMPLHLPVKDVKGISTKSVYFNNPSSENSTNDVYDLEQLLSVKNLERYLSHLVVLLPVLEVDKPVWLQSYSAIINTYLDNSNSGNNQNIRSIFFLTNALKLTQSAIAQEAILAGEPLLETIHNKYRSEIFSTKDCTEVQLENYPESNHIPFTCSARGNRLFMKNLMMYSLFTQVNGLFEQNYADAYKKFNREALAKLINANIAADRLEEVKDGKGNVTGIVLKVTDKQKNKIAIKLPTPEELTAGKIMYSENMSRLLKMQNVILNSLEKVAPVKRQGQENDLIKLLMVGA